MASEVAGGAYGGSRLKQVRPERVQLSSPFPSRKLYIKLGVRSNIRQSVCVSPPLDF